MKAAVTIPGHGVVKVPAKLRPALGLEDEGQLSAGTTPDGLLLSPAGT